MNRLRDFDKEFNKQTKRAGCLVVFAFMFNAIVSLGVLGGIGYVAYLVLKHFGIVG